MMPLSGMEPSTNKGEVQKSEQPVCSKRRKGLGMKKHDQRIEEREVIEVKIKWSVKGVTLPFISNRNTCQNVGSENCIAGFIIFLLHLINSCSC